MITSSSAKYALCVTVIVAILAGCSAGSQSPFGPSSGMSSTAHQGVYPANNAVSAVFPRNVGSPTERIISPNVLGGDLCITAFLNTTIQCYASRRNGQANKGNGPPACTISGISLPNDVDGDASGNVIDPDGGTHTIKVFGPHCGALKGSISDPYGNPDDAVAVNAVTGRIVVATIVDNSKSFGSVTLCTLKAGCTANLTSSNIIGGVAAVAVNRRGNCWAVSENASTASLTYFKGCTGSGQAATGFLNKSYGGLDIDSFGNIVSIDFKNTLVYVYKGCNPACTVVGGPFTLHGESIFGHLDRAGNAFATVEHAAGQVDIYSYTPTTLTYLYSFSNGLNPSSDYEGVAYAPSITK